MLEGGAMAMGMEMVVFVYQNLSGGNPPPSLVVVVVEEVVLEGCGGGAYDGCRWQVEVSARRSGWWEKADAVKILPG